MSYCLIVEDDPTLMLVAKAMVEKLGYEVQIATNAESGLGLCSESMPRVVLLDWNLPDMDGLDFIAAVQKMPKANLTSIIMCTGESSRQKVVKALQSGAKGYIVKPLTLDALEKQFQRLGLCNTGMKKLAH